MLKAIIAEDEVNLLRFLRKKLEKHWPELNIVAECYDGKVALEAIDIHQPEIVFLDIQMNQLNGIELAAQLPKNTLLVFVTAYDNFAIKAFEFGAVDYLVKPFSDARLMQCVKKLKNHLNLTTSTHSKSIDTIKLSIGTKSWLQPIADIKAICAQGRYVEIICENRSALLRMPFKDFLDSVDRELFWQVNRGIAVNIKHLSYLKTIDAKHMELFLTDLERSFSISRRFQSQFKQSMFPRSISNQ